ncbi:MAG: DNA primase [Tissierellia bacterium]|nr:DNA primase [Tissierellia bacterium]
MAFQEEDIKRVKDQANIVSVIGEYVDLKRAGRNYKGLCPFHNEKTPSFIVSEERQHFRCFGCGESGDVISFLMKRDNMTFMEAVEHLAARLGITLDNTAFNRRKTINMEKFYRINEMAMRFYFELLLTNTIPRKYLRERRISDASINKFFLGYAPNSWDALFSFLVGKGVKPEDLMTLGLISQGRDGRYYDRFRNRLMFPIIDTRKRIIGFGGRTLGEDNAKYINSSESVIFEKGKHLYGLNLVQKESNRDKILLVEGYMDVIGLNQQGINFAVASLGTALTPDQAKLVKRFGKDMFICYDSDNAGIKATDRAITVFQDLGLSPGILQLPEGTDPDEFILAQGKDAFLTLVDQAVAPLDFRMLQIKGDTEGDPHQGYQKLTQLLAQIQSAVMRDEYIAKAALLFSIRESSLREDVQSLRSGQGARAPSRFHRDNTGPRKQRRVPALLAEAFLLSCHSADYYQELAEYVDKLKDYNLPMLSEALKKLYDTGRSSLEPGEWEEALRELDAPETLIEKLIAYPAPQQDDMDGLVIELVHRLERDALLEEKEGLVRDIGMLIAIDEPTPEQLALLKEMMARNREIDLILKTAVNG